MRDRPQPGSLAEWSDDDMDSPPKPTKNAADLVQFARKGVRHALSKQGRRYEAKESFNCSSAVLHLHLFPDHTRNGRLASPC